MAVALATPSGGVTGVEMVGGGGDASVGTPSDVAGLHRRSGDPAVAGTYQGRINPHRPPGSIFARPSTRPTAPACATPYAG